MWGRLASSTKEPGSLVANIGFVRASPKIKNGGCTNLNLDPCDHAECFPARFHEFTLATLKAGEVTRANAAEGQGYRKHFYRIFVQN